MMLLPYHDIYGCTGGIENPPELVLVHGWGMHGAVWDQIMPDLLTQFQITVVDLPGMGRSPLPSTDYTLDFLAESVLSVAPSSAVWLGWSLGGMVAIRAGIRFPEQVQAVITTATTPRFVADEDWPLALNGDVLSAFITMFNEDMEGTLIRFLSLQCKGSHYIKEEIRELRERLYLHGIPARRALLGGLHILQDADLRTDLASLNCPNLHIFGGQDELVPCGVSQALKGLQPQANTAVIKGVSHVPFLSVPELFIAACRDFLATCEL